jgi:outer membrane protein
MVLSNAFAQDKLTLDQAVQLALSNNLQLQIARNDAKVAHNNNIPGNAGLLPEVSLNASDNPSLTNINQKFTNGTTIERNNVFSHSANANILATYTLYNGSMMHATKRRLEVEDMAANNLLKSNIQTTVSQVIMNYSNIVRQRKYLQLLQQLNDLSSQRLDIVKSRQIAGLANNTDLYLAQLDLETRKQNLLTQQALIKNAYTDLNVILNMKVDSMYEIEDFVLSPRQMVKSDLDSLVKLNPDVLVAQNQVEIAMQAQKEIGAARSPLIRLSGAYVYNISQSQAGFSLYNQSMGPQAGISLSIPLFTGGVNQKNYENAKLNVQSSEWRQQQTFLTVQGLYAQSWQDYSTAHTQLHSDSIALNTAKSYIDLMQQRFSAGQNTIIELKEAQRSYEETYYRFINNQYIVRLAETQLMGLTGQLVRY